MINDMLIDIGQIERVGTKTMGELSRQREQLVSIKEKTDGINQKLVRATKQIATMTKNLFTSRIFIILSIIIILIVILVVVIIKFAHNK